MPCDASRMPRQPRIELPGVPLHVTQRGVNRCAIFVDDVDREHFHALLCQGMSEHEIPVHAYVFMGNHIHLLVTPPQRHALSRVMRHVETLWQGRFKSCPVETERYLMTVYRYIELNPVRAAMVARAEQHCWSSIHANPGLLSDPLVTPHHAYIALDREPVQRALAYQAWPREGVNSEDLDRIRTHLQKGRALGDRKFQIMIEKALGRPASARPRGRPRRIMRQDQET
jgi:putative transposase